MPPARRRAVVDLTADAAGSCREVPIDLTAVPDSDSDDDDDEEYYHIGDDYPYGGGGVQHHEQQEEEEKEHEHEHEQEENDPAEDEAAEEDEYDSDATISVLGKEDEGKEEEENENGNENENEEEHDSDATISLHEEEEEEEENEIQVRGGNEAEAEDCGEDEDGCEEEDEYGEKTTESEYYRERNDALDSDYEPSETMDGEEDEPETEETETEGGRKNNNINKKKNHHRSAAKRVDIDLTGAAPSRSATLTGEPEQVPRQQHRRERERTAAEASVATPPPTPPDRAQSQHQYQYQHQQQQEDAAQNYDTLPFYTAPTTGLIITPGAILDIEPLVMGTYNAHIFRVTAIRSYHPEEDEEEDAEGRIALAGVPYARAREMKALVPKKLNEVCLLAECAVRDGRPWRAQAVIEIDPAAARRVRPATLRTTNAPYPTEVMRESPFPSFRFDVAQLKTRGADAVERDGVLVCRYAYVRWYDEAKDKKRKLEGKAAEYMLCCVEEEDADPEFRVSDTVKRNFWRGGMVSGGSHIPGVARPDVIVIDDDDDKGDKEGDEQQQQQQQQPTLRPGQTYTAGDIFCGCGGASRGMDLAGVKISFAVDNWPVAVRSYRENFPDTTVHQVGVFDFLTGGEHRSCEAVRVDLLHLSPPCQAYSPAHTRPGVQDEANEAALFSCGDLVERCRPRLFTIEQTFGIVTFDRYRYFLNSLVASFVHLGYSARWSVIPLSTWGLPQMRRRLIMIGAGPGEKLPPFPDATHSAFPARDGLLPLVSPLQTLRAAGVPVADRDRRGRAVNLGPMHDPGAYKALANPKKKPWDPNQLLKTVTCGGSNWHWSGTRDLTPLEYAILQGFPPTHRFIGKRALAKHQIGNAFPPSIVRRLYEHLVAWLDRQDGLDPDARRRGAEEGERARGPVRTLTARDLLLPSVAAASSSSSSSSSLEVASASRGAGAGVASSSGGKRKRRAAAVVAASRVAASSRGLLEMEVLEEVVEGDEAGMAKRRQRKGKGRAVEVKEVIVVGDDDEDEDDEVVVPKRAPKKRRVGGGGGGGRDRNSSSDRAERIEDCIVVATDWW